MNDMKLAIIVSRFNEKITQGLLEGALARLQELNFSEEAYQVFEVPGAVEIPITAQRLAQSKRFDAIVTLGAVIQGETRHFDYVCDQVSQGCQQVSLKYDLPVIFGVLTTDNGEQALARIGGAKGNKGRDAVDCAVEMVQLLERI
jgi:6,7-dimethyl-8-ribityllumazine synthase